MQCQTTSDGIDRLTERSRPFRRSSIDAPRIVAAVRGRDDRRGRILVGMELSAGYQGLGAFYEANPCRRGCDRIDFGIMWYDGDDSTSYWRVGWLEGTGEVYAYDLAANGRVVVLAERLRRPVVQQVLAAWEHQHALSWVCRVLTFPLVTDSFSGYVSQPEKRTVWVMRDGWWERPLKMTNSARRANSRAMHDIADDLYILIDSILADYFGSSGSRLVSDDPLDDTPEWSNLPEFSISTEKLACVLASVGIGHIPDNVASHTAPFRGRVRDLSAL